MGKSLLLLLLVLWAAWGVGRLLLEGGADDAEPELGAEGDAEPGVAPSRTRLSARVEEAAGEETSSAPAPALPADLTTMGEDARQRLADSLAQDPGLLIHLLYERLGVDRRAPPLVALFAEARALVLALPSTGADATAALLAELLRAGGEEPEHERQRRHAALLGALSATDGVLEAEAIAALHAFALDQQADPQLRALVGFLAAGRTQLEPEHRVTLQRAAWHAFGRENWDAIRTHLRAIGKMNSEGRTFLPGLIALQDSWYRSGYVDPELLETLFAVDREDPRVWDVALRSLSRTGNERTRALQFIDLSSADGRRRLLAHLEHANGAARVHGIGALLEAGVPAARVALLLLPALVDESATVRTQALALLTRTAQRVTDIVPVIRELYASKDAARWLTATELVGGLSRLPGERGAATEWLWTAARMPDTKVRIAAVQALLMHDANRAEVITLLADLLRDTEAQVRREAIDGLGELVAHDPSARAHIESALSDSDADVRALARYWLTEEEDEGSDVAGDDAQGDGDD